MMLEVVLGVMDLEVVADEKDDEKVVDLIFINFVRSSSGEHGLIEILTRSKPFSNYSDSKIFGSFWPILGRF